MDHIAGAQNRANITAFLNQNPGEHNARAVATALGMHYSTAINHLEKLAEGGLIHMTDSGTRKTFRGLDAASELEATAIAQPNTKRKLAAAPIGEIEFVVGGMLVIMGRNPRTGRLRILLEEAK